MNLEQLTSRAARLAAERLASDSAHIPLIESEVSKAIQEAAEEQGESVYLLVPWPSSEIVDPPLGESGEEYYCKREEFTRYIQDKVNPARERAGLKPLDLKTAEECYRILNDFARKNQSPPCSIC